MTIYSKPTMESCGVPHRQASRTYITGAPERWSDALAHLIAKLPKGNVHIVLGDRATGKTQLAAELVRYAIETWGGTAEYATAITVFNTIKATFKGNDRCPDDADAARVWRRRRDFARFEKTDLLIIDEAHERGESAWENQQFTHLVDQRYGDMKTTIIIANLTPGQAKESLGSSICSRATEGGGIIQCTWPSFRTAIAGWGMPEAETPAAPTRPGGPGQSAADDIVQYVQMYPAGELDRPWLCRALANLRILDKDFPLATIRNRIHDDDKQALWDEIATQP